MFVDGASIISYDELFQVAAKNVGSKDIKEITMEAFDSITVQDWKNACEHIKKIEKEYYDRGRTLYDDIDQLVIQLGDDSSSSEDEYEYTNEKMLDDINVGASSSSDINVGASTSSQIEYLDFDLLD